MITIGYVKGYKYTGDGALMIQVRIPSVHGPYSMRDYKGNPVKNYTQDGDLPWYGSVLLPHLPNEGDVAVLTSVNNGNSNFLVIGLTGGSYQSNTVNLGG